MSTCCSVLTLCIICVCITYDLYVQQTCLHAALCGEVAAVATFFFYDLFIVCSMKLKALFSIVCRKSTQEMTLKSQRFSTNALNTPHKKSSIGIQLIWNVSNMKMENEDFAKNGQQNCKQTNKHTDTHSLHTVHCLLNMYTHRFQIIK